jgi:predicted amidohydrolase
MPPIYKVAVIQLYSKPLDVADNFSRAAEYIRSAAAQGAVLAVLPEYHLTGWEPDRPGFMDACQLWENYLARYRQMAKALKICIVPGTLVEPRKDEATGELALFNVAYFIDDQGGILGSYIKKNIWYQTCWTSSYLTDNPRHSERAHLSSGRQRHEAIDTPIGKVGMLICWDIAFPEAFRELITQGAKIIIVPCFWGLTDCSEEGLRYNPGSAALVMDSTLTTRAFENTCGR